ncbi:hypothetical protein [Cellulomonas sp. URHE0023]|uniref:hypothetical protein n=1 Tax=Cellulomonas sp. URHE0023 TaxID=1380354 RepID=UPI000483803C|nr:hypothetical protein [Cellulomonas sp. URHE0023]
MTSPHLWEPLGTAASIPVVDELSIGDFHRMPARTPLAARTMLDVVGRRVTVVWEHRVLVATTEDGVEVARGGRETADSTDTFFWNVHLMPVQVPGGTVTMERQTNGRDRWLWQVHGPEGRAWQWRPVGRIFADRMELTRDGESTPVVTHELRPVPGRPRPSADPPLVAWTRDASLVEVLLPVLWVLDRLYGDLLPKAQRIARGDVF